MGRIAYAGGRYVPHAKAHVHVEDRGYQFADAVYEVIAIHHGRLIDEAEHLERLDRSLRELAIAWPLSPGALRFKIRELIRRNKITARGMVYLQISRGVAPRNHIFPKDCAPVLVMTARTLPPFEYAEAGRGVRVITAPDERWRRCDIKSVSLLANVLARQRASEAGAFEAWLVDDAGLVTEGTASNAWIITADGLLLTHDASHAILNGITRRAVLRIAGEHGVVLREGPFSVAEATSAAEAFLTSTTSLIKPVTRIDDAVIGDGRLGPLTARLLDFYAEHVGERGGERGGEAAAGGSGRPGVTATDMTATGQAGTLAPPQAVLFDWDNTLIDSWAAIQDAQNYTLAYFGLKPWTLAEVRARVRGSMRDTFPAMFGERWREAGEVFYARFTEHHLDALKPLPGAEEMLRSLQESGVYLGVVSNKKGDYLRAEAARLGWQGYFGSIVGAFDAARDKPATDPVLLALAGSGITCHSVWFAGDTDIDLECARNAGCLPVLVREAPPAPGEFTDHPPAVHVPDCTALLNFVRSL